MSEDRELMDFIKAKLEGDVHAEPPGFKEILHFAAKMSEERAKVWRPFLWGMSLVAASLLAVCSFVAVSRPQAKASSQERTIANVIDILRAADGIEATTGESSVADMLLAWQDVPYESAISELCTDAMTCL